MQIQLHLPCAFPPLTLRIPYASSQTPSFFCLMPFSIPCAPPLPLLLQQLDVGILQHGASDQPLPVLLDLACEVQRSLLCLNRILHLLGV